MADEGSADRTFIADAALVDVGFGRTGDIILFSFIRLIALCQDAHMHTDRNGIQAQVTVVHDAGNLQGSFQVSNAGFNHSLLFLGGIVFRVLRKVTVTTGNLDLFSNLGTLDSFQGVQFFFQLFITLMGNNNFFGHCQCLLSN